MLVLQSASGRFHSVQSRRRRDRSEMRISLKKLGCGLKHPIVIRHDVILDDVMAKQLRSSSVLLRNLTIMAIRLTSTAMQSEDRGRFIEEGVA